MLTQRLPAAAATAIPADPELEARAWIARADENRMRWRARQFGPDVAALLDLSAADAWDALRARAADGDGKAATAALLLADECNALRRLPATATAAHSATANHLDATTLPTDWIRFLRAIDAGQQARLAARIAGCAGVGGVLDFGLMVLDRMVRPDDPAIQLAEVEDDPDDARAIADLRRLAAPPDAADARRALGERLMQSRDPQERDEGRAMLEGLAPNDASIVSFLASCLRNGCGFFPRDPDAAPFWLEQAAGLGFTWALRTWSGDLQATGHMSEALAWSLYRLELARAGCSGDGLASMVYLAQAAEDAFRLEAATSAGERAQARAALARIIATWEPRTMAAFGCGADPMSQERAASSPVL
ncbi:MAG TPA: hypothetical protein VFG55_02315 [Rhodanobacteraceae bacterium]|nr:hypothetical protein [Rhodanobacteraceae bacterium]